MNDERKPPNAILNVIVTATISTVIGLVINKISHLNVNIIILIVFVTAFVLAVYYAFYWYNQTKILSASLSDKEMKLAGKNKQLEAEKNLNDDFAKEIRNLQSRISTLQPIDESPLLKIKKVRDGYNFNSEITQD